MSKNEENKEAEELVADLNAKHRDVLEPILGRVNQCYLEHDGDGIFYLYQSLVTLAETVHKMIQRGTVIPQGSGPNRPGMNA